MPAPVPPVTLFPLRLELHRASETGPLRVRWYPDGCQLIPAAGGAEMPLLPDRVHLFAGTGDERDVVLVATGGLIPRDLLFRPPAAAPGVAVQAWKWIHDFEEAERVGMGVTIARANLGLVRGARWLFAVGQLPDEALPGAVERVLASHRAAGKLGLLGRGTATNHTEAGRAGEAPPWPGSPGTGAPVSNAASLARTLGIDAAPFSGLAGASSPAFAHARAANALLAPICKRSLEIRGASREAAESAAASFVEQASPFGDVPALRIGDNPYGIVLASPVEPFHRTPILAAGAGLSPRELRERLQAVAALHGRVVRRAPEGPDLRKWRRSPPESLFRTSLDPPTVPPATLAAAPFPDEPPEEVLEAILQQGAVSRRVDIVHSNQEHARTVDALLLAPGLGAAEQRLFLVAHLSSLLADLARGPLPIEDVQRALEELRAKLGSWVTFRDAYVACRGAVQDILAAVVGVLAGALADTLRSRYQGVTRWLTGVGAELAKGADLRSLKEGLGRAKLSKKEVDELVSLGALSPQAVAALAEPLAKANALSSPALPAAAHLDVSSEPARLLAAAAAARSEVPEAGEIAPELASLRGEIEGAARTLKARADAIAALPAAALGSAPARLRAFVRDAPGQLLKAQEKLLKQRVGAWIADVDDLAAVIDTFASGPKGKLVECKTELARRMLAQKQHVSRIDVEADIKKALDALGQGIPLPEVSLADLEALSALFVELCARLVELCELGRLKGAWAAEAPLLIRLMKLSVLELARDASSGKREEYAAALRFFIDALTPPAPGRAAALTPEQAQTLLMGSLDVFGHRFDVWASARAAASLTAARSGGASGNGAGVFGWLENPWPALRPATSNLPFFQAPSIDQGKTVAVLRAASLTHEAAFKIDLSSTRARAAQSLLSELRQGISLGDALRLRLERALQEPAARGGEAAALLPDLRAVFPEVFRGWLDGDASTHDAGALAAALTAALRARCKALFERSLQDWNTACAEMARVLDAFADVAVAEAVYQHIRGNPERVRAWMEAVEGGSVPPDPEVLRTPRSSSRRVQRAAIPVAFRESPPASGASLRSLADPGLDALAAALLGVTGDLPITVETAGEEASTRALFLNEHLGMRPIDLVFGGEPEIRARVSLWVAEREAAADLAAVASVVARTTVKIASADTARALSRASKTRALLACSRPLRPDDIEPDDTLFSRRSLAAWAVCADRARRVLARIDAAVAALGSAAPLTALVERGLLSRLHGYGNGDVLGRYLAGGATVRQDLLAGLQAARAPLAAEIAAFEGRTPKVGAEQGLARLTATLARVTGDPDRPSLFPFEPEQTWSLDAAPSLFDPVDCLSGVRESLSRMRALASDGLAFRHRCRPGGPPPAVATGTLPSLGPAGVDLHLYLPLPVSAPEPPEPLARGRHLAGLLVDEWVDVERSTSEVASLVFRREVGRAEAPNAILVAVPEPGQAPWTPQDLARCLFHVTALMQIRSLTTDDLLAFPGLGSPLPCIEYKLFPSARLSGLVERLPVRFSVSDSHLAARRDDPRMPSGVVLVPERA